MGIEIRPFVTGDLAAVNNLWNRTMGADPISEQRLLREFVLDPHFDQEAFLLAQVDDAIVGFVLGMAARKDLPSDNAVGTGIVVGFGVDEVFRRQGIGSALFERLESYWRSNGVDTVQVGPWIPTYLAPGVDEAAYPGTVWFLEDRGFVSGAKPVSMRALLTSYEASADVPGIVSTLAGEGIEIRRAIAADAVQLVEFASRHFPHWESYVRWAMRSTIAAIDTDTLHVALDGGTVIGFAMSNGERFGPFGVNSDYRGRGVGAVLLSRTLSAMRAANVHLAYFLWTSDQTACLYNRHGFEIVRRFTMLRKSINKE